MRERSPSQHAIPARAVVQCKTASRSRACQRLVAFARTKNGGLDGWVLSTVKSTRRSRPSSQREQPKKVLDLCLTKKSDPEDGLQNATATVVKKRASRSDVASYDAIHCVGPLRPAYRFDPKRGQDTEGHQNQLRRAALCTQTAPITVRCRAANGRLGASKTFLARSLARVGGI